MSEFYKEITPSGFGIAIKRKETLFSDNSPFDTFKKLSNRPAQLLFSLSSTFAEERTAEKGQVTSSIFVVKSGTL